MAFHAHPPSMTGVTAEVHDVVASPNQLRDAGVHLDTRTFCSPNFFEDGPEKIVLHVLNTAGSTASWGSIAAADDDPTQLSMLMFDGGVRYASKRRQL